MKLNLLGLMIEKAYAQELIPCKDGSMADPVIGCVEAPKAIVSEQSDLLTIVLSGAHMLVGLAVLASVAVLIYGGIVYASSMGNEERMKKAKQILFWSVFGLAVSLLAKYIVKAVLIFISQ